MAYIWRISAASSGVLIWHLQGRWEVPLLRINTCYSVFFFFYPVLQLDVLLGTISVQTCSSILQHPKLKTQPPDWLLSQSILGKFLYQSIKWTSSFTLYPPVLDSPWFCFPPTLNTFLMTRGLRGTYCCPCIIFPFLSGFVADRRRSDGPKSELGSVSRPKPAFSFSFSIFFYFSYYR